MRALIFSGAIMSAEIATITSAFIQGWFTIIGAFLGAAALIGTFWFGAKSALNAHKADKLAEAKRDNYLELVKSWFNFILVFSSYQKINDDDDLNIQMNDFFDKLSLSFKDLTTALHQSSFISEPLTKEKILDFTMKLSEDYFYLTGKVAQYYLIKEERNEIYLQLMDFMNNYGLKCLELQKDLRIEIGISEDDVINSRILKKQKEFAEKMKNKIMKIRDHDFEL